MPFLLCTARVIDLFNWSETLAMTFRDLNIDNNIMTCLYLDISIYTHLHRPNTCNRRLTTIITIVMSKKITVRRLPYLMSTFFNNYSDFKFYGISL